MPELPEVETITRALAARLPGRRIAGLVQRRPDLRFPLPARLAERLVGRRLLAFGRRGKYILGHLDDRHSLVLHLGMSGRFLVTQGGAIRMPGEFHHEHGGLSAHDHVVFQLSNGATVTYNDARRFGFMDLVPRSAIETSKHFAGMGIEPLGNELSGETIARLFEGKRTPLKAALLDQRLIAGLGNIYVSEALFHAGISPRRLARTVQGERAERLAAAIKQVLEAAIAAGASAGE